MLERYFLLGGMAFDHNRISNSSFYYYYATVHYSEDMYYEKAKASAVSRQTWLPKVYTSGSIWMG